MRLDAHSFHAANVRARLRVAATVVLVVVAAFAWSLPAVAHNGPPFPIIVDQRVGPCVISLWTHPDVGIGTFFVLVDPPPGGTVPKDLKIQIGVQPVSGRLPEVMYSAWQEKLRGQVEFKTEVQFDQQEFWKVRLVLQSAAGGGEALSKVEATPPGFGQWDLLLYLLPFLGVGFLWFSAIAKRRAYRKRTLQQSGASVQSGSQS
jgi:hypothetical protein